MSKKVLWSSCKIYIYMNLLVKSDLWVKVFETWINAWIECTKYNTNFTHKYWWHHKSNQLFNNDQNAHLELRRWHKVVVDHWPLTDNRRIHARKWTMDPGAHSYEFNGRTCDMCTYEFHMNFIQSCQSFIWISYELHMENHRTDCCALHMNFIRTSYEFLMNTFFILGRRIGEIDINLKWYFYQIHMIPYYSS